ncbi:hypothetical protein BO71DRAFT_450 [Aspergillus ellipticus CBS 707.79]|uniref:Uncharacterized protein n=1 Tax=Aspergillus ellipticus CBS 707.79 TaxID=1448320 RepID=A0A319DR12_9EURO|nr:hypothetical protein BO71DRAFT_450 [Aspergillus ellipticus CBS 707.79]
MLADLTVSTRCDSIVVADSHTRCVYISLQCGIMAFILTMLGRRLVLSTRYQQFLVTIRTSLLGSERSWTEYLPSIPVIFMMCGPRFTHKPPRKKVRPLLLKTTRHETDHD